MEQKLWKNNLRELRKERGLSQQQVGKFLGMKCQNRLSRWEKGVAVPTLQNLVRMAKIYGVEVSELYK